MFNFKEMISRVAHGQSPSSPARNNEPDTAEGFLCPLCMNAFGTQDELQSHYSTSHKDSEPPPGNSANAETSNVFHVFHQGVGDKYIQTHVATVAEEAKESIPEINSLDLQLEISKMAPDLAVKELVKKLNHLLKQKDLLGEEKVLAEQRAVALTEKVAILMATAEKAEMDKSTLAKRLAVVEAQLAHRENIDDAAVLRQELIQVQRVMDEMTREREMESDQLKRDLQNLQQKYNLLQSESKKVESIEKDSKRMEMLEESIQQKDERIAEINDKLTMLKETVSSLENDSFQKSSKLTETEMELEKSKSLLSEFQSKEESSQKRIAELEERLMEASLAQEKSKKELRRLEEATKKDSQIILDLKSEISENSNHVSVKNKELIYLNEKVEILTSQLKEYTIMNEDLRCRNAEQARHLEDKMKLVSSMEDKEKEMQSALEKNVAQMESLNKNYLELMGLVQAQMKDNNKVDSDSEKKILGQIESAVNLLTKKTSEFDNLAANDKQLLETLQKEGKNSTEELIKMLQSECKDKSEQLMEANRKINSLSNEMQSKINMEKAKTEELEAIINSYKLNLEQCRGDLVRSNKMCQELEDKISEQRNAIAKKVEEMSQLNAKHSKKVSELKKVASVCFYLRKELLSCKEALSSFSGEWGNYNKLCLERIQIISDLHAQVEKEAKVVPQLQEDLFVTKKLLDDKNNDIEELTKKLQAELKRSSELEDSNSIKLMEIEELKNNLGLEKDMVRKLSGVNESLSQKQREMKEHIDECEDKVKSLTSDLLASEKIISDLQIEKEQLEAKIVADLHDKEAEIQEILEQSEERFQKQSLQSEQEIAELNEKYQEQMKKHETEIESLSVVIAKEEQQKEEVKKNLEEELLANSTLQHEFSLFRNKHDSTVAMLNDNVKSLTVELGLREEADKVRESMIEKLQEQNSSLKAEWETERQALLERYIESTKENERLKGATNELRRRLEDSQAALHEIGRENQTYQMELAKLSGRKWTEDSDVKNCMKCDKEFSIRIRKHHCRNCGQIFCNDCSSKMAAIASNKKPVRVCEACYIELVQN